MFIVFVFEVNYLSIINYDKLLKTSDMRIVKTKRAIYNALIELFKTKALYEITITELCKAALINRKTFYSHFDSVADAYAGLEYALIKSYLSVLESENIIGPNVFDAKKLIYTTNKIVEDERDRFELIFQYLRTGMFMRKLGETSGYLVLSYTAGQKPGLAVSAKSYAFVFAITGLVTSYFDWVEFGRVISIDEMANTAEAVLSTAIKDILES